MTTLLKERNITTKLLIDDLNMWDEFDIQKNQDPQVDEYYKTIMELINQQIQNGVKWLGSDIARDYFFGEAEYQQEVFQSLEEEWDTILNNSYTNIEELLKKIYHTGKQKGYQDIHSRIKYTETDKQALKIARNYNYHLIQKIDNDTRNQIKNVITKGVIAGEHPSKIAPQILNIAETQLKDSIFTPKQRATMIARTETSRVQNTGILQSYINEGYQEVKILTAEDDNVCYTCLRYAFEFNDEDHVTFENRGKERIHNIIKLVEGDSFPPFHPNCRCTYLSVWKSKGEPYDYVIDLRPSGFKTSEIPSVFPADNTSIEELNKKRIQEQIEGFKLFTEDKDYECLEIYYKNGETVMGIILGDEGMVAMEWQELRKLVHKGAFIVIHNHPPKFDNLHSHNDLVMQLKSGIKYSIVESYTKRYIVVNTNKELTEDNQLVKDIQNLGDTFLSKIDNLTEQIISKKQKEKIKLGQPFTVYELEDVTKKVREEVMKKHFHEYEEKLSKFFSPDTGLTLFVHDK